MDKSAIIEELDRLKLRIMIDESIPDDIDRFQEWIDKIHMKGKFASKPWSFLANKDYARFSMVRNLVQDLYHRRQSGKYEYHKNKPEITRIVVEAVAMTLFVLDELEDSK